MCKSLLMERLFGVLSFFFRNSKLLHAALEEDILQLLQLTLSNKLADFDSCAYNLRKVLFDFDATWKK